MVNSTPREWSIGHDPLIVPLLLSLELARKVGFARARHVWDLHGLTPSEFDVLATLRNEAAPHELTPGQIQDRVLLTSGGLTKVIHLLEAKSYVERSVATDDNRVKPVRLTAAGKHCVGLAMKDLVEMMQSWVKSILTEDEIKATAHVLQKIVNQ
ncbi:MAG: MarR family winged helix-turn-helix transcriptional regulator [Fluviibacter sp.]